MKTNTAATSQRAIPRRVDVAQPDARNAILAEDLLDHGVPDELHLRLREGALLQDRAGAQLCRDGG